MSALKFKPLNHGIPCIKVIQVISHQYPCIHPDQMVPVRVVPVSATNTRWTGEVSKKI